MAHHVEPMDIDSMDSDFDNKENTYHHSNVLPCTEKGYEELDVSELNMKLRYSITPASSPMSKSYTAHCHDNRHTDVSDDSLNTTVTDNLTRSLNSTMTKNDSVIKSLKMLPLQMLPTDQYTDGNRNVSVLRQLDSTITADDNVNNVSVIISGTNEDENVSLPSSSSSTLHTPEATTPTKDIPKDGGSPIMRGLKSVLNMFRSSQSPVPPEVDNGNFKHEIHNPDLTIPKQNEEDNSSNALIASTPIAAHRNRDTSSKRSSPYKESIVFNDDLEKELQWKGETNIILSHEKAPIQKLSFQQAQCKLSLSPDCKSKNLNTTSVIENQLQEDNINTTVECMDISYNDSMLTDRTMTEIQTNIIKNDLTATESDSEFLDCETTFSKNESQNMDNKVNENVTRPKDDIVQDVTSNNEANSTQIKEVILETIEVPLDIHNDNEIITKFEPDASNIMSVPLVDMNEDKVETNEEKTVLDPKDIEQIKDQVLTSNEPVCIPILPISRFEESPQIDFTKKRLDLTITDEVPINNQPEIIVSIDHNDREINKLNTDLEPDSLEYNEVKVLKYVQVNTPNIESPREALNTVPDSVELSEGNKTYEMPATESPADIPLPEEDDIENELDITVDSLAKDIVNVTQDLLRVGNISSNIKLDETLDKSLMDVLSDKMTENIENALLTMTTELSNMQSYTNEMNQNMSLDSIQLLNDIKNFVDCDSSTTAKLVEQIESEVNAFQIMDINESIYDVKSLLGDKRESITLPCLENQEQNINKIESESVVTQSNVTFDNAETDIVSDAIIVTENKSISDIMNTTVDVTVDEKTLCNDLKNEIEDLVLPEAEDKILEIESSNKDIIKEDIETITIEDVSAPKSIELDNDETENKLPEVIMLPENNCREKISLHNNENITDPISEITNTLNDEINNVVPDTITSDNNVIIHGETHDNNNILGEQRTENLTDKDEIKDEEIIVSANTSPFVSMSAGIDLIDECKAELDFENIDNSLVPEIVNAPPTSPAIVSKGYNFNFDEMDDPFATKINIRTSPPPNTPNKTDLNGEEADKIIKPPKRDMNKNRRKSQPEKKKSAFVKNKFNATFDGADKGSFKRVDNNEITPVVDNETKVDERIDIDSIKCLGVCNKPTGEFDNNELDTPNIQKKDAFEITNDEQNYNVSIEKDKSVEFENQLDVNKDKHINLTLNEENNSSTEPKTIVQNEFKNTSSSEQSTYYSVGTSSNESIPSRNVFNLPEIDDMNFNPFANKSKLRQSPPPNLEMDDPFATKSNMKFTPESSMIDQENVNVHDTNTTVILNESKKSLHDIIDKMETEKMEKDTSANISNTTCSSKAADERDTTVREVHTEDEDTEEGPFLEADDLNNLDKMSDFDGDNVDMMQLNDFPTQSNNDNLTGEMFIDAETFEFLLNQNKSNVVADSGKESLFLKFDPLFAKRISSDGVLAALSKVQRRQNTPTKATKPPRRDLTFEKSPTAGPSKLNSTYEEDASKITDESSEDLNVTVSKPMMVVTPAVNPVVTPRNKSLTPTRSNRHSITFTSPAMAVIDRLLSMSANNSLVSHDTTITHATREQNEADLALTQLRELLAEKEIHVYNLRAESKEMKDRLMTLESQMNTLESESQKRLANINDLNGRLSEKTKINRSMAAVVEEYERTIASLIAEIEQDKKQHAEERMQLIKERDEQTAHLASMEVSFSDLHSKYEKSKQIILSCKANEDTYKKSIKECVENFNKMQNNYELLKQHATTKLNHANQEMEKTNRSHEAEVLKLNAMIKRKDLHITSLEETLTQKTKANEELTAICDELINKVG